MPSASASIAEASSGPAPWATQSLGQRKRDHGNLLFIDLRDHYGVTQVVVDVSSPVFKTAEAVRNESVITVSGKVVAREASTVNPRLATGAVELDAGEMVVQSMAE